MMLALERAQPGSATNIEKPLEQIAATVVKRGLVVLISDLLTPIGSLKKQLGFLRARGHEVVILRVLDPRELDFQFDKPAMFHDVETGRDLFIDPQVARQKYLDQFQEHSQSLTVICRNLGVELHQVSIDRSLVLILFDLLSDRMKRGRSAVRQRSPGAGKRS